MRNVPTIVCMLAVGVGALALPASAQTDSAPPSLPKGLHAPARVGRYVRGDVRDYGSPTLGVAYQYKPDKGQDSSWATLYLYQREPEETDWPGDSVASFIGHTFKDALDVQVERGVYDRYTIAFEGRDSVMVGTSVFPGYYVAFVYRYHGAVGVSFLYLYVVDQRLVKIRGTVPESHWQETDLPNFARGVAVAAIRPAEAVDSLSSHP